jgi:hypothetical protein
MSLDANAAAALATILGIMMDHLQTVELDGYPSPWSAEHVIDLDTRVAYAWPELVDHGLGPGAADGAPDEVRTVELHIEDAELLLAGMAFTEMASVELPWFDMVRWTSDFVAGELRALWPEDTWRTRAGRTPPA